MFACQVSQHFIELGNDCTLVSIFDGEAKLPFQGKWLRMQRPISKRLRDFNGWKQLAKIIKEEKPDVIQANAGDTLKFAISSKLVFRWKQPLIFRNANKISDFIDSKPKFWLNNFFIKRLSHVISVSELCNADFQHTFNFPPSKITTGTIGIECKKVGEPPVDLKDIFSIGPVITNVGSLVPEKNHKALLSIFEKVKAQIPGVQLIIIGKGRLEAELKSQVKALEITDSVHFLGHRHDVLEVVKASQVFAMPSLIEGLPGVILESQYCKTPVVAYDVGGISEVVERGKTGWLVEKGDSESFVESTLLLLKEPANNEVVEIVDRAYQQVIDDYDNRIIAKKFIGIYEKVVEDHFNR